MTTTESNDVLIDQRGPVLWLTINREERRNAMSHNVLALLAQAITAAQGKREDRSHPGGKPGLRITGEGRERGLRLGRERSLEDRPLRLEPEPVARPREHGHEFCRRRLAKIRQGDRRQGRAVRGLPPNGDEIAHAG